jgi:hypothetical protein
MICDPETGNATIANAFADLTTNYSTKKNVATFLAVLVGCFPVLNGEVEAYDKDSFLNIPKKDQAKNIANHLECLMVHCWLGHTFETHGNTKEDIKSNYNIVYESLKCMKKPNMSLDGPRSVVNNVFGADFPRFAEKEDFSILSLIFWRLARTKKAKLFQSSANTSTTPSPPLANKTNMPRSTSSSLKLKSIKMTTDGDEQVSDLDTDGTPESDDDDDDDDDDGKDGGGTNTSSKTGKGKRKRKGSMQEGQPIQEVSLHQRRHGWHVWWLPIQADRKQARHADGD